MPLVCKMNTELEMNVEYKTNDHVQVVVFEDGKIL